MVRSRSDEVIADSEEEQDPKPSSKKSATAAAAAASKDQDEVMEDAEAEGGGNSDDEDEDEDGEEEEYEIEAILDSKMGMFKPHEYAYFVKWKGYDESENSWVAQEDAVNAQELIDEYWKTKPKGGRIHPVGKKRSTQGGGSVKKERESLSNKREPVSSKRESSVKIESSAPRRRKSVSRHESEDSEIEFIEKVDKPKKRSTLVTASSKAARASEEKSDEEDMLKPVKKLKSNGTTSSSVTRTLTDEKEEAESDALGATAVEDEDVYPTLPDMAPYMNRDNWEQLVQKIDTVEMQPDGTLRMYLTLDNGQKASHDAAVVRQRCPQKVISFYESHLRWKQPRT